MNCPHCGHDKSRVTETRAVRDGDRRIRLCRSCGKTFTTMERIAIWFGPNAGWMDVTKDPPALQVVPDPEPEPEPQPEPAVAKRASTRRWHPVGVPVGVCEEAAPMLLEWWNESRRSKHGSHAVWSERAWLASVERVKALPPAEQVALCKAGVEHGWQALKREFLKQELGRPVTLPPVSGRPMPKDPAMLAALEEPWTA